MEDYELLEKEFDKLKQQFDENARKLRDIGIVANTLELCESLIIDYGVVFPQLRLAEATNDKWSLFDSSISLVKTLDKRLKRMVPRAKEEIDFWMKQPYDKSHKSLLLQNADILSMSLKNLAERFERQAELLEDGSPEEKAFQEIVLNVTKAQFDLEKKIEEVNKLALEHYSKLPDRSEMLEEYIVFKESIYEKDKRLGRL